MIDLRKQLAETWRVATRAPSKADGGRAIMFMSANEGEGVSSAAASFAMLAAQRARRGVWLVELDFMNGRLFKAFEPGGAYADIAGTVGGAHNADLGKASIYSVAPEKPKSDDAEDGAQSMLSVHRVGDSKLLVSRFRKEKLGHGQQVKIKTGADYWKAVRGIADWIVVDAPALSKSSAGLAVCSQMDATALVVQADKTPASDVSMLGQEIEGHGGVCMGMMLNKMGYDAVFADQFSG